jgi:hypothetical protein
MTVELVARNYATASENRIHSDEVARKYGLRGGLVPGVTVYGYLVTEEMLERGPVRVRFVKPVFDGDRLAICEVGETVTASRGEEICAVATLGGEDLDLPMIGERPLPEQLPEPHLGLAGTVLGTFRRSFESAPEAENIPAALLSLANESLMRNFRMRPWMHVASQISHRGRIQWGNPVAVYARIHDCFEKKGREFLVADIQIESEGRVIQWVRHTALYRL